MADNEPQASNYPDGDTAYSDLPARVSAPRKWHAKLIANGGFLILTFLVFFMIDMFANVLAYELAFSVSGLTEDFSLLLSNIFRLSGIGLFAVSAIGIHFRWFKFSRRVNTILNNLIFLGMVIVTTIILGIGFGGLLFFALFLFEPKYLDRFSVRVMQIYRIAVVGIIIGWMVLEVFLSAAMIGFTILPAILTAPLTNILGPISLIAVFVFYPIFFMLPKVITALWRFRKSIEGFWLEFIHEPMGLIGLFIIGGIVILALIAPILEWGGLIYNWGELSGGIGEDLLLPPSPEHPLGTNQNGQDILSRLVYGTQISLLVGFTASVVAVFLGTAVGLISGYFGGFIDTILMRITDVFLSLPTLPLMLIFLAMFGQGLQNVIIVIAILGWTGTARMVRSEALSLRERPLTEAAHALGATDRYILIKHILPNTLPLILANVILGVVNAILSEAGIAFLGFVDIHGQPSWGIMLHWANKNAALLNSSWWWIIPPGLLILLTALGFVFISHAADKVVNPRLRGRRG
ncbi:MAG: ABC transporter permease [Candidatus Thorarchaeota archaeon]|jgi:ABC-type dipeptide/oligopeptide/nickel transport system permease subunit